MGQSESKKLDDTYGTDQGGFDLIDRPKYIKYTRLQNLIVLMYGVYN